MRQDRAQQPMQPRERQIRLGLHASRGQYRHRRRPLPGVVQQRRLADPGLASDDQRPAGARAGIVQQPVDGRALRISPEQPQDSFLLKPLARHSAHGNRCRGFRPGPPPARREAGHRRVGTYSLGMRQRLTLATTLLGDPGVLILDEPLNGLDPDGIRWMRDLLRHLAGEGRTVLVSSHLLAEAAQTVDDVVVIHQGRLAAEGPVAELAAATGTTRIRTPDTELLMSVLARQEITARLAAADTVEVRGADPDRVARIASAASVTVLELTRHTDNLEELFFDLTSDHANARALEVSPS